MTLTTRKVRDGVSERETTQSEAQDDGRIETRQHGYSMWDETVPLQSGWGFGYMPGDLYTLLRSGAGTSFNRHHPRGCTRSRRRETQAIRTIEAGAADALWHALK